MLLSGVSAFDYDVILVRRHWFLEFLRFSVIGSHTVVVLCTHSKDACSQ